MGRGPESGIQSQVVRLLHNLFDCRVASNNNGGFRSQTEAFALADMGTWAGYPDLSVFGRGGQMFLLECKAKIQVRERGVDPFARFHSLSATQKVAIPELRERGFRVAVTDSVEEAKRIALAFGLGMKMSAPLRALPETGF